MPLCYECMSLAESSGDDKYCTTFHYEEGNIIKCDRCGDLREKAVLVME